MKLRISLAIPGADGCMNTSDLKCRQPGLFNNNVKTSIDRGFTPALAMEAPRQQFPVQGPI